MAPSESDVPRFTRGLRGYSTTEVDEHVTRLRAALAAARTQAAQAQRDRQEAAALAERATAQAREAQQGRETAERALAEARTAAAAPVALGRPGGPDAAEPVPQRSPGPAAGGLRAPDRPGDRTTGDRPLDDRPVDDRPATARPWLASTGLVGGVDDDEDDDVGSRAPAMWALAGLVVLVLAAGLALFLVERDGGDDTVRAAPPAASAPPPAASAPPSAGPAPSAPAGTPGATSAPPPSAAPSATPSAGAAGAAAVVPEGWTRFTTEEGSTLALPPDWKQEGIGSGVRWVSASGLAEVRVLSRRAQDAAEAEAQASEAPDYQRLAGGATTFRGELAYAWDYTTGSGATASRGSDLAVLIGGTATTLHVQARTGTWPSVEPLVPALRGAFAPPP